MVQPAINTMNDSNLALYENQINSGNGIYRYKNLDNSNVYFNENIQRLIQNYRSSFLQLGLEDLYSNEENSNEKTIKLLTMMDDYFPANVIPTTDPELDIQIGRIYKEAGKPEELKKRLEIVQKRKDLSLESKVYIGQIYMNEFDDNELIINYHQKLYDEYPFIPDILYTLVQAYAKAGRNEDAINALELCISSHPTDSQAMDWLSILNQAE